MSKGVFQIFASGDENLTQALREFNDFRNKKKKPMTDQAKERLCRKLEKFPREQWIPILHQSIDKGWSDIYELKEPIVEHNVQISEIPDKYLNDPIWMQAVQDIVHGKV